MWKVCCCRILLCYLIFIETGLCWDESLTSPIKFFDLWGTKIGTRDTTTRTFKWRCSTFISIPWILFTSSTHTCEWHCSGRLWLYFKNTVLLNVVCASTQSVLIGFLKLKWGRLFVARRSINLDLLSVFKLFNALLRT